MRPMLPGAPFSMSPDAAQWVVAKLRAEADDPKISGRLPVLAYVLSSTRTRAGSVLERVPYPHCRVWWLDPKDANDGEGVWVEVFGRRIFVQQEALEGLRGKHLTLARVESTLASQQGTTRSVLRAAAEEKGTAAE